MKWNRLFIPEYGMEPSVYTRIRNGTVCLYPNTEWNRLFIPEYGMEPSVYTRIRNGTVCSISAPLVDGRSRRLYLYSFFRFHMKHLNIKHLNMIHLKKKNHVFNVLNFCLIIKRRISFYSVLFTIVNKSMIRHAADANDEISLHYQH